MLSLLGRDALAAAAFELCRVGDIHLRCQPLLFELGGDQVDYRDENPETRVQFEGELAKHGLTTKMQAAYAAELEGTGGKSLAAEEKEHA